MGRAEQRVPRVLGAVLLIVAGAIHLVELPEQETIGLAAGFALSGLATVAGALLLLTRGPRLGWLLGGAAAALTFIGYVLTRSVGLPRIDEDDIGNWLEPLGVVSLIVEALAVAFAIWALTDQYGITTQYAVAEIKAVIPGLTSQEP
ncbi:hypothetical protein C3Y87_11195 [Carbonactinospora thermoautotrophica]|uniref:hypothetical protein n=1 Tax=Carbonactinospora thermoautotrophica TaxID=1469144 RepID=UPI002270FD4D|nr:hypothetical protein [Carbonactinospora thermoautotrophica]MCX9191970.1 hypothetical protein [Carbonactinospora thermoautotrophica]